VVPPDSAPLVPHSKSSADTVPMNASSRWVCGSMPPGMMKQPSASITLSPVRPVPIALMLSPSIKTSET
jgi:hypothetical protein